MISMIDRDIHGSIQQALRSFYITVQLINKVHQHYKDTTRSLYYLTNLKVIPQRILVFVNYLKSCNTHYIPIQPLDVYIPAGSFTAPTTTILALPLLMFKSRL